MIKNRSDILLDIATFIPDNSSEEISAKDERDRFNDIVDSFVSKYGDTGILAKLQYSATHAISDDKDLPSKKYVDDLIAGIDLTGLWDDRGNYDASTNLYPSTGGSGTAGAILKGDIWTVSVVGTLGGVAVSLGDTVRSLVDTPAQVSSNWAIAEGNLGYTPLSNVLLDGRIFVGNGSNVAVGVPLSGDGTISNTGVLTVANHWKLGGNSLVAPSTIGSTNAIDWGLLHSGVELMTITSARVIFKNTAGQAGTGTIGYVATTGRLVFGASNGSTSGGVQFQVMGMTGGTTIGIPMLDNSFSAAQYNGSFVYYPLFIANGGNVLIGINTSTLPGARLDIQTFSNSNSNLGFRLRNLGGTTLFSLGEAGELKWNQGSDATGDTYYRDSSGVLKRLAVGTNGHVLTLAGGLPTWAAGGGGSLTVGTTAIASGTVGRILFEGTGNVLQETANMAYDITNGAFIIGGGAVSDTTSIPFQINTSVNAYRSAVIKNASAGLLAAGDFTAIRDDGTYTTNFLSCGINSSTYTDPTYPIQTAGSGYLFTNGAKLIIGTQTAHDIVIHTGGTTLADRALVIRSSGASKGYLGLLEGNANEPTLLGKLHIVIEDDAKGTFFADRYSATMSPLLNLRRSRGTFVSPTAVQSADGLGGIGFRGYGATGFSAGSRVNIIARASENWTDAIQGTHIEFSTTLNGGIVTVEKMRLTNDGSLWLGTTSGSASALVDLVSTTKGFGLMAMTTAQRDAITSPRDGLKIYSSDGTIGESLRVNSAWVSNPNLPARVTIPSPSSSENTTLFYTTTQMRVARIVSGIIGGTSVTFSIRYGADRSAAGTEVVTGGTACTNTTTGLVTTSFNAATIPANNFVWIVTTAKSGAVTELNVSLNFN